MGGCPGLRCAGSCLWFGGEHLGSGICNQVWSFVCVCVCFGGFELCGCRRVRDSKLKPFFLPSKGKAGLGVTILNSSSSSFCDYKFGFVLHLEHGNPEVSPSS